MCEDSHHDQGLAYDIQALLARRRFLKGLAASSAGLAVAGCDLLPWPGRAEAEVTGKAADGSVCIVDPAETAGPFPADGSNRAHGTLANVLSETGIVRRDMRPSIGLEPATVADALVPAAGLTVVTVVTKLVSGRVSAGRAGVGPAGRRRAGTALIARGEFSIVIASLGVGLADGSELGGLAAAYVLLTAIVGPLAAKYSDSLALPWVGRRVLSSAR